EPRALPAVLLCPPAQREGQCRLAAQLGVRWCPAALRGDRCSPPVRLAVLLCLGGPGEGRSCPAGRRPGRAGPPVHRGEGRWGPFGRPGTAWGRTGAPVGPCGR